MPQNGHKRKMKKRAGMAQRPTQGPQCYDFDSKGRCKKRKIKPVKEQTKYKVKTVKPKKEKESKKRIVGSMYLGPRF